MANKARRGKTKPWGDNIKYPGPDYLPSEQLPDLRLEQFAILIARNASRRRAVLTAFPNAAATATAYRAANLLGHPGILARVQWLRRQTADYLAGKVSGLIVDVPRDGTATKQDQEQERDARIREAKQCLSNQTFLDESEKRRDPQPADLTPAELRRIISEGARAGNSAAINAAIKMLDASLSAPPALVDPAAVCAVLFNGGGGGEALHRIILRLFDVFGAQAVADAVTDAVSHNRDYVSLNQSQCVAPQSDMKRDNMSHNGADGAQGAGQAGSAAESVEESVEESTEGHKPTGGTGEGGEPDRPSTYTICSENFEHENATKLRGKVPVIPKSDEEAPSEA
ncbi:MAG: hypothetical protein GX465_15050 [Acidobacteria bacterium]|nr:hypothetical protein [Acidobacteriota bacterium]